MRLTTRPRFTARQKAEDRIKYLYQPGGLPLRPAGGRTQKILHRHGESPDDAEIVTFHWTGLQMVGEQSSRQPARSTQYIYAEGGWEPLARVDSVGESSETYWYHSELNGLPERMTDQYGEVVWQGSFSTWGETERESSPRGLKQNLRFQGQYFDAETGLHYNLFRYYDPVAGRFTQLDPIGLAGGLNTYAYVPDPLTWVDPLGLSGCARALNRSMRNANKTLARLEGRMMRAWHKVRGSAAHHIVAWDDPRALRARLILEKHGIHIDSAENGIFLKHIDPNSIQPGAYHRVIHTNKYYDNIVSRIQNADLIDGKKGVIDELNAIRDDLLFNRPIY